MKSMRRNQQTVIYKPYTSKTETVDINGNYTGEFTKTYGSAVTIRASVSAAKGEAEAELFGASLQYSKTMVVDNVTCPIDEYSQLWVDRTTGDPDYRVVGVAKSLNHITYAIAKNE